MADVRGDPWEHDPGPTSASGWAELFAATPNYRGLGGRSSGARRSAGTTGRCSTAVGWMARRKVMVVGQEGAQDESLAHRSFTGGTGARMQHLLRFLGLDRSYLFLNSFVYPIFGQYTQDLRKLAQDPRSPIVIHRNRIFDKAVVDGDVRLVIAVGRAAKESVATWIESHGGTADPDTLHTASLGHAAEPRPRRRRPASGRRRRRARRPRSRPTSSAPSGTIRAWLAGRSGLAARRSGHDPEPVDAPSRTPRRRSRSGTSRSGRARASVAAGPRATAATTSGRSGCSRLPASTTPRAPT